MEKLWLKYAASQYQLLPEMELANLLYCVGKSWPDSPDEDLAERFDAEKDVSVGLELARLLAARKGARDLKLLARLLCAVYGDRRSAADIAVAITQELYAIRLGNPPARQRLVKYVLGWLAVAAGEIEISGLDDPVEEVAQVGGALLTILARDAGAEASRKQRGLRLEGCSAEVAAAAIAGFADAEAAKHSDKPEEMIVVRGIAAGTGSSESRELGKDFDEVNGKPLELVPVPDIAPIRSRLAAEFPYAIQAIDTLLSDLVGKRSIRIRPTLLVGAAGSGKSRLLRRILEELDLPTLTYPCGGSADSSIAGTARRWSSSEPSLPLRLVRDRECANPCIILDELDKSSPGSGYNGRLWDALMPWFEVETAARWTDPYVSTEVDLSAVVWLGTANEIRCLPDPLLDRMRIIRMPAPRREDLPALAAGMLTEISRERGLDERWVEALAGYEIEGLQKAWKPGSLRSLRRLVEGVMTARDQAMPRA